MNTPASLTITATLSLIWTYHPVDDRAEECRHELKNLSVSLWGDHPEISIVSQSKPRLRKRIPGSRFTNIALDVVIKGSATSVLDLVRKAEADLVSEDGEPCLSNACWESDGFQVACSKNIVIETIA